jgi:hypothetical protein
VIKPAYSVSFLLSINIFVWQNVLYFPNDPRVFIHTYIHINTYIHTYIIHTYIYIHTYIHIYINRYIHTYIHMVYIPQRDEFYKN